ncbi:MAG: NAD(P)H-dependent oxidoreductase subunit E [Syntrophomonadaceae bacterium]|nr:NAD(P)H-dependent oxidoreductase subunit E [Syntrophomonadaceae bacterium]
MFRIPGKESGRRERLMSYKEIIAKYADKPGGIIEAYHAIQREMSYLPIEAVGETAEVFKVPVSQAYGVATFYSMFSVKARGKNIIRLCESAPCHVAGAEEVLAALEKELGIKVGESTADGKFALELSECVGQCQATPVLTVNGKPYFEVSPAKLTGILAEYK